MKTKTKNFLLVLMAAIFLTGVVIAADAEKETPKEPLDPQLEGFRPFLGKTFRGEMRNSTPEKPAFDVQRFERALNGKAVRALHSINDGVYGGETLIFWDKAKNQISYFYFTTGGFYTTGSMTITNNKYTSLEKVAGASEGVTEVKGSGELKPDGTFVTSSEYLKEGKWVPGHGAVYKVDPKAEVKFK